jgi:hypothetical protein
MHRKCRVRFVEGPGSESPGARFDVNHYPQGRPAAVALTADTDDEADSI